MNGKKKEKVFGFELGGEGEGERGEEGKREGTEEKEEED